MIQYLIFFGIIVIGVFSLYFIIIRVKKRAYNEEKG